MLNVAALIQLIGFVLLFGYWRYGALAILAGLLCLVFGGVLYRRELKSRREEKAAQKKSDSTDGRAA